MNGKHVFIIVGVFLLFLVGGIYLQQVVFTKKVVPVQQITGTTVHQVALTKDKATPDALIIKVGEFVQFNSRDGKSHHISSGAGEGYSEEHEHGGLGLESGVFGPDEGYRVQFKKPGTFEFHDHDNPKTSIAVVVYQPKKE